VLAPGVEETAPDESLPDESVEPDDDEPLPESEADGPSSHPSLSAPDVPEDEPSPDDESYGSLDVLVLDVVVEVDVDVAFFFATPASAGSSPSWTRSASTPKIATKLAIAPAAKRRALGTRRRGRRGGGEAAEAVGSSGMTSGSRRDLKSS
jgi:hypothetical protein